MSQSSSNELQIELTAETRNGRRQTLGTARVGETIIFSDTLDVTRARSRRGFLQEVAARAPSHGIEVNVSAWDQLLLQQVDQADVSRAERTAPTADDYRALLNVLGIDVLGENPDQSIECWIEGTHKRFTVRSPDKLGPAEMLQAIGERAERVLWLGEGPAPPSMFTPAYLRRALALAASTAPRLTDSRYGQGIWRHGERFLVVNGATAFLYDGHNFQQVTRPTLENKIIYLNAAAQWTGDDIIPRVSSMGVERTRDLISALQLLLAQWHWTHPYDSWVQAALVLATFVQNCWTWRPLNSIIGPTDCGKSTLLQNLLAPIFGNWTIAADRSTEAGLRQTIGHNSAPVLIDEFDRYKDRQAVLELFRTSSRGGTVLRGTQNQRGLAFTLKHLAWFAAIELGDVWAQDRNRFIRAELRLPHNRGVVDLPDASCLRALGEFMLAAALWAIPAAAPLADLIKSRRIDGIPGRLVESYSVPAAMAAVMWHGREATVNDAANVLYFMIVGREDLAVQGETEENSLLTRILSANIRVTITHGSGGPVSVERSVAAVLSPLFMQTRSALGAPEVVDARNLLEAKGLNVVRRDGVDGLFLVHDVVRRELLKDTRWSSSRIDVILGRLPGAARCQQRCGGQRPWGIWLPVVGCLDVLLGQDNGQDNVSGCTVNG
jgi:hypothetical protein